MYTILAKLDKIEATLNNAIKYRGKNDIPTDFSVAIINFFHNLNTGKSVCAQIKSSRDPDYLRDCLKNIGIHCKRIANGNYVEEGRYKESNKSIIRKIKPIMLDDYERQHYFQSIVNKVVQKYEEKYPEVEIEWKDVVMPEIYFVLDEKPAELIQGQGFYVSKDRIFPRFVSGRDGLYHSVYEYQHYQLYESPSEEAIKQESQVPLRLKTFVEYVDKTVQESDEEILDDKDGKYPHNKLLIIMEKLLEIFDEDMTIKEEQILRSKFHNTQSILRVLPDLIKK